VTKNLPFLSGDAPGFGLTVHEWGTFTSVAGVDGKPVEWLPISEPSDLPRFVTDTNPYTVKVQSLTGNVPAVRGTVRMETPVLYFYSPREMAVDVTVRFRHGLVTEWYPAAKVNPLGLPNGVRLASATGKIEWNNVRIVPNARPDFPVEAEHSHYYAARNTGAAPVKVGSQTERFLFYRGVGSFEIPIEARIGKAETVLVSNSGRDTVPNFILFDNRDGRIRYGVYDRLNEQIAVQAPGEERHSESLLREFEQVLIRQGLYPKEAQAMIDTWRDSWFEQGTRIFYIVPSNLVDAVLPLDIRPAPAAVTRVFVGRMEVITPATVNEVKSAIARNDKTVLDKYGRFLEAIQARIQ
jgi:hypothetical protein